MARVIDIQWPRGGVNRRAAYQSQPPFTTPNALNVRTTETQEQRIRGGSRPGLVKAFSQQLGSGNPIRLLAMLRSTNDEGSAAVSDNFQDLTLDTLLSASGTWDAASWSTASPTIKNGSSQPGGTTIKVAQAGSSESDGVVLATAPSIAIDREYEVALQVHVGGTTLDATYFLWLRLDNTTPSVADSISVVLNVSDGSESSDEIKVVKDGNTNIVTKTTSKKDAGYHWLRAVVTPTNRIKVFWSDDTTPDINVSLDGESTPSASKTNVAFELSAAGSQSSTAEAAAFSLKYFSSSGGFPPDGVVASSNGKLYVEKTDGSIAEIGNYGGISNTDAVNPDEEVQAVDYLGKLYIADHGNRTRQTDGSIQDGGNVELTSASIADWTTLGIDTEGDWVEIISVGSGSTTAGLYKISAVAASKLTLASSAGASGTSITFRVVRGPKVYDSATDALSLWEPSSGNIPLGCKIINVFLNRILMAADPENQGVWYLSRSGDPDDFNFGGSATDSTRAIAGTATDFSSGLMPTPIQAASPVSGDFLILAGTNEIFLMRGDPAVGGSVDRLSHSLGIGQRDAWTITRGGQIVFLGTSGLYALSINGPLQPLSPDVLPVDLRDLVPTETSRVILVSEPNENGCYLFNTPDNPGPATHWWVDLSTPAFWPLKLQSDHEPRVVLHHTARNEALLGCRDGYIRRFSTDATDDDGVTISSLIDIGPLRASGSSVHEALISDVLAVLDEQSGDVALSILRGDNPEEALSASAESLGTLTAGRNRLRPRARTASMFLRLEDSSGSQWSLDELTYITERKGRIR